MHVKQICQLHPVDPKNKFSARQKKQQSVHIFSGFKVSAYSRKHVHVCLIALHGASKISLWAYKRPGV